MAAPFHFSGIEEQVVRDERVVCIAGGGPVEAVGPRTYESGIVPAARGREEDTITVECCHQLTVFPILRCLIPNALRAESRPFLIRRHPPFPAKFPGDIIVRLKNDFVVDNSSE